jgi:predicted PurR-regulated permease PerM
VRAVTVPRPVLVDSPPTRSIVRVVVIVVVSGVALYLVYLVREPLGYIVLGAFVAICAAGPVGTLSRYMKRGYAVLVVYAVIVLTPVVIGAILIPPIVRQTVQLVDKLPEYTQQLKTTIDDNPQLKQADENFDLTKKLQNLSNDLSSDLGKAAGALVDVGAGLVGSIFAIVEILVLSMFMVGRGRAWRDAFLKRRPPPQARALRRASDDMAAAVSGYVGGAIAQALVAGAAAFLMLEILGVPEALALALIIAIFDVIPLVGATIGAVIVGIFTAFADFPVDTIVWTIFAIAYQQFENYVVQPRIQSRAVDIDPFIVIVAALFGAALLGVIGAILAIPTAATVQVAVREYLAYRDEMRALGDGDAALGQVTAPAGPASSSASP